MTPSASVWLVIALALAAANLPFLTQRLFGLVPLRGPKGVGLQLLELLALYFVVGGIGRLLESRAGQIAPQGWEFYAITGALFLTFAFPGFVWRYLLRQRT